MTNTGNAISNSAAQQTWLHYFNDCLRDRQIITEDEWRKMRRKIDERIKKKDA